MAWQFQKHYNWHDLESGYAGRERLTPNV